MGQLEYGLKEEGLKVALAAKPATARLSLQSNSTGRQTSEEIININTELENINAINKETQLLTARLVLNPVLRLVVPAQLRAIKSYYYEMYEDREAKLGTVPATQSLGLPNPLETSDNTVTGLIQPNASMILQSSIREYQSSNNNFEGIKGKSRT